jgi:DNA-binding transcriptional MerR regulator
VTSLVIPNRPVFRAQEVCELAEVQPYVLRTWEAEFPDLGVAKANGPRVYRRADVERVLRIKHLLFVDGLTLAGARKRLGEEAPSSKPDVVDDADVAALIDGETREELRNVRRGLQWILGVLAGEGLTAADFVLRAAPAPAAKSKKGSAAKAARPSASKAGKVVKKSKSKR